MTGKRLVLTLLVAAACGLAFSLPTRSQEPPAEAEPLEARGAALDAALSAAFNAHDLDRLMALFTEDVEFYHDNEGLQHRAGVEAGFRGLFAQGNGIERDLVPGSLAIYPLPGFGLLEVGSHRFCHQENGRPDCGTFSFAHVWRQEGPNWRISRVLSYGHRPAAKAR